MLIVVEGAEQDDRGGLLTGMHGRVFWPLCQRFTRFSRIDCTLVSAAEVAAGFVNIAAHPLIMTIGAVAGKAVLGDQWTSMQVCNSMSYTVDGSRVVPIWPISVSGSVDGKDPLAWLSDGLQGVAYPRNIKRLVIPDWEEFDRVIQLDLDDGFVIGIDTEGLPTDPQCLTFATAKQRVFVEPEDVPEFWRLLEKLGAAVVYHNAPWDWSVIQAMGVSEPWKVPFRDTMELAYLRQTEPQGLKDLGKRHFGVDMVSWEDTVMPWYEAIVSGTVDGRVAAGTVTTTHSPKTGKKYKFPKIERSPEIKKLAKLTDVHKKAKAIGFEPPSLRHVPFDIMAEYATLDPFITRALAVAL